MATFQYKATTKKGDTKMGSVQAPDMDSAMKLLQQQNLIVTSLKPQKSIGKAALSFSGGVKDKDVVVFSRQFAVMVSSGLQVTQALRILVDQTENQQFRDIIKAILLDVEAGARLSEALEKFPKAFSQFFVSMVRSGESSGQLAEMLLRIADQVEKDYNLVRSVQNALIYPLFIILLLVGISFYVLVWVVPQLTEIFNEFDAELPLITRFLIGISDFAIAFWWLILVLLASVVIGFRYYLKTEDGQYSWDYSKMRMPIMGPLINKISTERLSRTLSTLIAGDIPIVDAMKISSKVPQNKVIENIVLDAAEDVKTGEPLSESLEKHAGKNLPIMMTRMVSVGETTGSIDGVLVKVADFYRAEIDRAISLLTTLLEPVVVVIIGIGVGILIAAVLLPIYNLASVI